MNGSATLEQRRISEPSLKKKTRKHLKIQAETDTEDSMNRAVNYKRESSFSGTDQRPRSRAIS